MIPETDRALLPQTRIHPINLLPGHPAATLWLKREDESGYAIAGGKKRKFASLIPWLKAHQYRQVALIGGANSNNALAGLQLLRENGIRPIVFRKPLESSNLGNGLLSQLLEVPEDVRHVPRENWSSAPQIAEEWAAEQSNSGIPTYFLPEGAACAPAFPGAMTLASDIGRNAREAELDFDHIFVDAGTGHSAAALAFALAEAGMRAQLHIVLMAEDEEAFERKMTGQFRTWFLEMGGNPATMDQVSYELYRPSNARSFGATNRKLMDAILRYARELGVLTDPIYSGKLLLEAERIIPEKGLTGNILLIHSGGTQTLPGFAEKFNF